MKCSQCSNKSTFYQLERSMRDPIHPYLGSNRTALVQTNQPTPPTKQSRENSWVPRVKIHKNDIGHILINRPRLNSDSCW